MNAVYRASSLLCVVQARRKASSSSASANPAIRNRKNPAKKFRKPHDSCLVTNDECAKPSSHFRDIVVRISGSRILSEHRPTDVGMARRAVSLGIRDHSSPPAPPTRTAQMALELWLNEPELRWRASDGKESNAPKFTGNIGARSLARLETTCRRLIPRHASVADRDQLQPCQRLLVSRWGAFVW